MNNYHIKAIKIGNTEIKNIGQFNLVLTNNQIPTYDIINDELEVGKNWHQQINTQEYKHIYLQMLHLFGAEDVIGVIENEEYNRDHDFKLKLRNGDDIHPDIYVWEKNLPGLRRNESILYNMREAIGKTYLIPCIESAQHFSIHKKVIELYLKAAKILNVQLFITSYSREYCIKLLNVLKILGNQDDFYCLLLGRDDDGEIKASYLGFEETQYILKETSEDSSYRMV